MAENDIDIFKLLERETNFKLEPIDKKDITLSKDIIKRIPDLKREGIEFYIKDGKGIISFKVVKNRILYNAIVPFEIEFLETAFPVKVYKPKLIRRDLFEKVRKYFKSLEEKRFGLDTKYDSREISSKVYFEKIEKENIKKTDIINLNNVKKVSVKLEFVSTPYDIDDVSEDYSYKLLYKESIKNFISNTINIVLNSFNPFLRKAVSEKSGLLYAGRIVPIEYERYLYSESMYDATISEVKGKLIFPDINKESYLEHLGKILEVISRHTTFLSYKKQSNTLYYKDNIRIEQENVDYTFSFEFINHAQIDDDNYNIYIKSELEVLRGVKSKTSISAKSRKGSFSFFAQEDTNSVSDLGRFLLHAFTIGKMTNLIPSLLKTLVHTDRNIKTRRIFGHVSDFYKNIVKLQKWFSSPKSGHIHVHDTYSTFVRNISETLRNYNVEPRVIESIGKGITDAIMTALHEIKHTNAIEDSVKSLMSEICG